ncbi:MAG: hypothetical protein WKG07_19505 [Hymenobacter sp.]
MRYFFAAPLLGGLLALAAGADHAPRLAGPRRVAAGRLLLAVLALEAGVAVAGAAGTLSCRISARKPTRTTRPSCGGRQGRPHLRVRRLGPESRWPAAPRPASGPANPGPALAGRVGPAALPGRRPRKRPAAGAAGARAGWCHLGG